jgi:hypothetical protein
VAGLTILNPAAANNLSVLPSPSGLLCELLSQPDKMTLPDSIPKFGWIVPAPTRGIVQSAYQIEVTADGQMVWDSVKILSVQSMNIEYGGGGLVPTTRYAWCVRIWDVTGTASGWSPSQIFVIAAAAPSLPRTRFTVARRDGLINQLGQYDVVSEYSMPRHSMERLTMSQHWASEWMTCSPLMAWRDNMYTGNTESIAKHYDVLRLETLHGLARNDGLIGPRLHPCFISDLSIGKDANRIFAMANKEERVAALEKILRDREVVDGKITRQKDGDLVTKWASRQLASVKFLRMDAGRAVFGVGSGIY